jgi:two-component system response regulator NreC
MGYHARGRRMAKVRILLADDHAILRAGLRVLINAQADMEVVAEAASGREAVETAVAVEPDVAIVDITMPDGNGVWVAERLHDLVPKTRVLTLTMHEDQAYLKAALAAGASGFVVKRAADTELLQAIRTVVEGRLFIDASFGDRVLAELLNPVASPVSPAVDTLTAREQQVLVLLAHGCTNKQAAEHLGLSMRSIETYRSRLSDKLGFQSRVDLVRYAIESGLMSSAEAAALKPDL